MSDTGPGYLEVGTNKGHDVVVKLPRAITSHIVFSPAEARALATTLIRKADDADGARRAVEETARLASRPPVDRAARTLTDGSPVTSDHREINPITGQQKGYVVLSAEERAQGFVRPVRDTYKHRTCGTTTRMGISLAETYARDPGFYSGTFCVACGAHFPLDEFVWDDDGTVVGS